MDKINIQTNILGTNISIEIDRSGFLVHSDGEQIACGYIDSEGHALADRSTSDFVDDCLLSGTDGTEDDGRSEVTGLNALGNAIFRLIDNVVAAR